MKTFTIAALLLVTAIQPALAGPSDSRESKGPVLKECLDKAGFTQVETKAAYEEVRWTKPNHYFLGDKILISSGSDSKRFGPCLTRIGAE